MVEEICIALFVILLLIVIVIIILNSKPISYKKKTDGVTTTITITSKRNLEKITVVAFFGKEEMRFERKKIKKKQSVEFAFPSSKIPSKIILEVGSGNVREYEV